MVGTLHRLLRLQKEYFGMDVEEWLMASLFQQQTRLNKWSAFPVETLNVLIASIFVP